MSGDRKMANACFVVIDVLLSLKLAAIFKTFVAVSTPLQLID
jgi:hypothetical protein